MTDELTIPDTKVGCYSKLCVMKSAAGYYVGTYFREEWGYVPGSRDSCYFATIEEAKSYLRYEEQYHG